MAKQDIKKQGCCYKCGSTDLYFKNSDGIVEDNYSLVFYYKCGKCGETGKEIFKLTFVKNIKS